MIDETRLPGVCPGSLGPLAPLLRRLSLFVASNVMNFQMLRVFCSIVERQSFSRGAAENNMTQSAATQCVQRFEEEFGTMLLDRRKRPFVLTAQGKMCHQAFRRILDIYDTLNGELRSSPNDITGNVYVAAIYSVGLHGLGNSMHEFMKCCPRATVRLEYLRPADVYEAVKNGMVDLGIVSYPVAQPGLSVVLLRSERMVVACHPDHPLAKHHSVSVHMLQGENLIGFDRGLPIRKDIDRCLRRQSVSVQVVMEFDNIETIKHAVEIGGGISIVPEPTVCKESRSGNLAIVRLSDCELRRPIGLIYLDRKIFTPVMSKFVELLEKVEVESLADVG